MRLAELFDPIVHVSIETAAVEASVAKIIMSGNDQLRIQCAHFSIAVRKKLRSAVNDRRWTVNHKEIAREHVAREEQISRFAVESAVAGRVAREMHDAQSSPEREHFAVFDEMVDRNRLIEDEQPADPLEPSAPARDAVILIGSGHVRLFERVGVHRRP